MSAPESPKDFEAVFFSPHANEKMTERRIDDRQVGEVLRVPDRRYPGNKPGRIVAELEEADGSTIRVVYVVEDGDEAMEKVWPQTAARHRRTRREQGIEYEPYRAAVVVTVIRIKKRRRDR